ncbi:MAG: TIGR03790 family protein [Verrucomicrobiota bacterium]
MSDVFVRVFWAVLLCLALGLRPLCGADSGRSVVLIYNSLLPESRDVARHYAAVRNVPPGQIIGLDLPAGETMTRAEYRGELEAPLLDFLQRQTLMVFPPAAASTNTVKPIEAKVRYAVLCFGVPLRIAEDSSLREPGADTLAEGVRRNGAAVDSELCLLPSRDPARLLAGPLLSPWYGTTNPLALSPTNGLLLVARLDGPTAAIARQLVDKAIDAETNGLWGRAYFDLRGLTNGDYRKGDDWIGAAADMTRRFGFETVVDNQPETFSAAFPMSQIALYAGWYDANVSGPFARPKVEFMPGAFAYHLHSASAQSLRTSTEHWCGPLLAAGVTATMGCVDEPYLDGTPNVAVFFARWLLEGFSFGEAAYACQHALSWQTTVIGDPLYRPFGKDPRAQHQALLRRHSPLIEWSHLRVVNLNLALGSTPAELAQYLKEQDATRRSAVLNEKLADLCQAAGQYDASIAACRQALRLDPTPQQRVRLTFSLADKLAAAGKDSEVLALYDSFLKKNPDYPDSLALYKKLQALATRLHQPAQAEEYAREIQKRTPAK